MLYNPKDRTKEGSEDYSEVVVAVVQKLTAWDT